MKIFATRIASPTPGHDTATEWRVAVCKDNETAADARLFKSVEIFGTCRVVAEPDSAPQPHVYIVPDSLAVVLGLTEQGRPVSL